MRLLIVLGLAVVSTAAPASPWPVEASVAYVEELSLACAKADPESASRYEAKKSFLFSEDLDRVKQAQSVQTYPDMRKWAHDTIQNANPKEIAEECRSFLAHSDLALKHADPDNKREPVPAK
ncbi:MAG: hypothetical protein ACXV2B_04845 [Halobacteriota archaeon]